MQAEQGGDCCEAVLCAHRSSAEPPIKVVPLLASLQAAALCCNKGKALSLVVAAVAALAARPAGTARAARSRGEHAGAHHPRWHHACKQMWGGRRSLQRQHTPVGSNEEQHSRF